MSTLDPTDTLEVRREKLHEMDKKENPEKHNFSKSFYSLHEWNNMCFTCGSQIKHLFLPDVSLNGFRRKK